MIEKTMVMKILDAKKIEYEYFSYEFHQEMTGEDIARLLGEDPNQLFKTLVTVSKSNKIYVFVIPVNKELDLKKAAKAAKEKSIEMVKSKDLYSLTGYIHGGCSPIGMKKSYITFFDESINDFDKIMFSAGKVGLQVKLRVDDVKKIIKYSCVQLS